MIDPTIVSTNHLATNLVTKGGLNISILDKGMLVQGGYPAPMMRRRGGGAYWTEPTRYVDPNAITISIDWFKKVPKYKVVHVEEEFQMSKNIKVELIQESAKPRISAELVEIEIN